MSLESSCRVYAPSGRPSPCRGTVRIVLLLVTLLGWSALPWCCCSSAALPVAALFTLAVLAAGFEAIHALHVGVERIGRYLQVYLRDGRPMARVGNHRHGRSARRSPAGASTRSSRCVFASAAVLNLIPALVPEPTPIELECCSALHLAFLIRVVRARGAAARQRAVELETFRGD